MFGIRNFAPCGVLNASIRSLVTVGAIAFSGLACGQDPGLQQYPVVCQNAECAAGKSWWSRFWSEKQRSNRYGPNSSRLYINPPVCEPNFGYYQPCWRQLHVERRYPPCETITISGGMHVAPPPAPSAPPAVPEAR